MGNTVEKETREFQAEVKQLLDIVVNSLYTDREIFLRELISNAADALEKLRYQQVTGQDIADGDLPMQVTIETDDKAGKLIITDTGIGMARDELVENLGTIAHSGSKAFIRHLAESDQKDLSLIGQFGVGFYSAFMVAEEVTVYTRSYRPETKGCVWNSQGTGSYTLDVAENLPRGTKIVLTLKQNALEFCKEETVKKIIKQYSGFVPFPIYVNGEKVNTIQALWTKNKNEIAEEEYNEFYKYIANAVEEPLFRLHFSADAPLSINAILFVPKDNLERFGFGRMEPGVSLYCRKVLIQRQSEEILPQWLRFIRGVIDSEELPLNISRETMQDSMLVSKLRRVITGRLLKFLNEMSRKEPEKYKEFWDKFGMFIKEGAATDPAYRKELVNLLRFESSKSAPGELVALKNYVERMKEGQDKIYYISGPSREAIEKGPYTEVFRARDIEVLYTKEPADDYILSQLGEYEGKKLVSADRADLGLPVENEGSGEEGLEAEEITALTEWMKKVLGDKVTEVRKSQRLVESPAVILSPDGIAHSVQRVMQLMNKEFGAASPKVMEINVRHPVVKRLNKMKQEDENFAKLALEQIYDTAMLAAGLLTDPANMVGRGYKILERALE